MSKDISQLNAVYQYAATNKHSELYRELYGPNRPKCIESAADWELLPFLTKDIVREWPFLKRLFTEYGNVPILRVSSGTTGTPPVVWPRARQNDYQNHFGTTESPTGILTFYPPRAVMARSCEVAGKPIINILAGDPENLDGSVLLAKSAGSDHIMCTSSMLEVLIPILIRHNVAEEIRCVEFGGERITAEQRTRFTQLLPNALLLADYGATDTQGLPGITEVPASGPFYYTPTQSFYWEIINEDGTVLSEDGAEGEVVISHVWTEGNPFPLLRYRTGDLARIHHTEDGIRYEILGRVLLDRIKLPGGEIRTDLLELAVHELHPSLSGDFELHFSHVKQGESLLPHAEVRIAALGAVEMTEALHNELAEHIAQRLRVAPSFTYADGVARGFYAPLSLVVVPPFPQAGKKRIRLFLED